MIYETVRQHEERMEAERKQLISQVKQLTYLAGIGVMMFALMYGCVDGIEHTQPPKATHTITEDQKQLYGFFQRHGSPVPDQMAAAVAQTKRPALMSAIAVVESKGNPKAVGDGGKSHGAFQVQQKHWGKVPESATDQALQAERILEELTASNARGSLRSGLAKYNGGNRPPAFSYRYADRVMKLAGYVQ